MQSILAIFGLFYQKKAMSEKLSIPEIEAQRVERAIIAIMAAHVVGNQLNVNEYISKMEERDKSLLFLRNRAIQQALTIGRNQLRIELEKNQLSAAEIEVITHYLYTWLDTRGDINFGPSTQLKYVQTDVLEAYLKENISLTTLPDFINESTLLRSPYSDLYSKERVGVKALVEDLEGNQKRVMVPTNTATYPLPYAEARLFKVREFFEALVKIIKEIFITDLIALSKQIDIDFKFEPRIMTDIYLTQDMYREFSGNIEERVKEYITKLFKGFGEDWKSIYSAMEIDYQKYVTSTTGNAKLKVEGDFFAWVKKHNRTIFDNLKTLRKDNIYKISFIQVLEYLDQYDEELDIEDEDDLVGDEIEISRIDKQLSNEIALLNRMYQLEVWKTHWENFIEFIEKQNIRELAGEDVNLDPLYEACTIHDDLSAIFISIDEVLFKLSFDNQGRITLYEQDIDDYATIDQIGMFTIERIQDFLLAIKEEDDYYETLKELRFDKLPEDK
jgi:hypothetical protein